MTKTDLVKEAYVDALLELCDEKNLNNITVNDVIARVGTARQTFYNRFQDINELILYVSTRMLDAPWCEGKSHRELLEYSFSFALKHKSFFSQVPFHNSQNNYRESFIVWSIEANTARSSIDLSKEENIKEKLQVILYSAGAVDLLLEWCKSSMTLPTETVIDVMCEERPPFIVY